MPGYRRAVDDVVRGLRQALGMLAGSVLVALTVAGVWTVIQGGGLRVKVAIVLMVIAALVSFTGGNALSRGSSNEARAFLGWGPEREDPDTGPGLTGMGVFLFVSLPLFVAGGVLYGAG
jgi:hypothetical protein